MGTVIILFLTEVCNREIRKQIYKASLCLCDKTISVRKEQNIFDPAMLK